MKSPHDSLIHKAYLRVNKGKDKLYAKWGYGCPLGIKPIKDDFSKNQYHVYSQPIKLTEEERDKIAELSASCAWTDYKAYQQFLRDHYRSNS